MPPPSKNVPPQASPGLPFEIVSPEIETVTLGLIVNIRNRGVAGAVFRSMVNELGPGPTIVRFLLISNAALVKPTGLVTDAILKVIVDASHASTMA